MSDKQDLTDRFKKKKDDDASGNLDNKKRTQQRNNKKSDDETLQEFVTIGKEEFEGLKSQINLLVKSLNVEPQEVEQPSKPNLKRRSFDLPNEVAFRLKLESALSGKFMNDIVLEALESWFKQNGKAPESLLKALGDMDE